MFHLLWQIRLAKLLFRQISLHPGFWRANHSHSLTLGRVWYDDWQRGVIRFEKSLVSLHWLVVQSHEKTDKTVKQGSADQMWIKIVLQHSLLKYIQKRILMYRLALIWKGLTLSYLLENLRLRNAPNCKCCSAIRQTVCFWLVVGPKAFWSAPADNAHWISKMSWGMGQTNTISNVAEICFLHLLVEVNKLLTWAQGWTMSGIKTLVI